MAGIDDLIVPIKPLDLQKPMPEAKPVINIQGVPIDVFKEKEEKERLRIYEVDPEDELKFLARERKLLESRLDNKDLSEGKRPPSRVTFWSIVALALGSLVGILKLLGVI